MTIVYGIETDCAAPFNYGGYKRSGDELHLEYSAARERMRAMCTCGYELRWRIRGLEKRDYKIDVREVAKP